VWPSGRETPVQRLTKSSWRDTACSHDYNRYNNRYESSLAESVSVRHALLALLSEEPKHGLLLQQEFEEQTGEVWPLNVGQVYITLQRLERAGLVASEGEEDAGPRKRFMITSAGGDELQEWLRTPASEIPPPRDELLIKVLVGLRVPGADVHEIVQVHRRHIIESMQHFWRLKEEMAADDIGLALIADAEMFRLEGIVRWLDAADIRLRQYLAAAKAPPHGGVHSSQPALFQPPSETVAGSEAAPVPAPSARRSARAEK
jgi:DNA-binding PadR family transcriptional regulator